MGEVLKKLLIGTSFKKNRRIKNEADLEIISDASAFDNYQATIEDHGEIIDKICNKDEYNCTFEEICSGQNMEIKGFLKTNLQKTYYNRAAPIQIEVIPYLLRKQEMLFCSPTGTGKTLAYAFPLIQILKHSQKKLQSLIIVPTNELCDQIFNDISLLAESSSIVISTGASILNTFQQIKTDKHKYVCDVLVSTPKRLIEIIQNHDPDILKHVSWLIFDEGDLLFDTSHKNNFCAQISTIYNACTNPEIVRIVSTATINIHIEKWVKENLHQPVKVMVYQKNLNVKQEIRFVGQEKGKLIELLNLLDKGLNPPIIIFVNNIEEGKQLKKKLNSNKVKAKMFVSKNIKRKEILDEFRVGKFWILITTDVLGRGIDFKGLKNVINYSLPYSVSVYIHRIGRTGRFGNAGHCITLFTEEDGDRLKLIAKDLQKAGLNDIPEWLLTQKKSRKRKVKN